MGPPQTAREEAWIRFKARRDPLARERLILEHAPLVKYVAGRMAMGLPPSVEVDDLISFGVFGLIDAIEKFDPARGVKFETYAVARIKGAILDGLRAADWIPHSVRRRAKEVERAYQTLEHRLGRSATDEEVAGALGMTVAELQGLLAEISRLALVSLEDLWPMEDGPDSSLQPVETLRDDASPDPWSHLEREERKRILAEAIEALPEKERLVVTLYYFEGLTAKEISQILGVSQSRISQIHSKALLRMRGRIAGQHGEFAPRPGQRET